MVNGPVALAAGVLVAPHHGADNGSSTCFIEAVDPDFVIFSAGSQFGHPRDSTARRYLDHGVGLDSIFRTDRGDDEDGDVGSFEWKNGSVSGCQDQKGDDDVDIVIVEGGALSVAFLSPPAATGC